jgi:hypothetical protein
VQTTAELALAALRDELDRHTLYQVQFLWDTEATQKTFVDGKVVSRAEIIAQGRVHGLTFIDPNRHVRDQALAFSDLKAIAMEICTHHDVVKRAAKDVIRLTRDAKERKRIARAIRGCRANARKTHAETLAKGHYKVPDPRKRVSQRNRISRHQELTLG